MSIGPYLVGVGFWIFMSAAAVAGIVGGYKRRRIELEPLRSAIERGQQLDPAIIEKLMAQPEHEQRRIEPLYLRIGGIITIPAGVGVAILSLFLHGLSQRATDPVLGAGALVACVGIGLLIAARAVERDQSGKHLHEPPSPDRPRA